MNRRDFMVSAAAFAAAGCTTQAAKGKAVEATTGATPAVGWKPFPGVKKVRVVQWGMRHEHASGKFNSLKKLPDDYELVGIVDDLSSKTPAEVNGLKLYDGVPRITPCLSAMEFIFPGIRCHTFTRSAII